MARTNESSRGIVIKDKQVLLIHRFKNGLEYFTIPGGGREDTETLEESVIRELLEETCVNVRVGKYLGAFGNTLDGRVQHLYSCEYVSGEPALDEGSIEKEIMTKDPSNSYEPVWFPCNKLRTITIQPESAANTFIKFVEENS